MELPFSSAPADPVPAGLIELCDLSWRPDGVTEILSMNCTEPEEEVIVAVAEAGCLEAPGLTVLQLVAKTNKVTMKMVVFNIFSTSRDIGTDKYSK